MRRATFFLRVSRGFSGVYCDVLEIYFFKRGCKWSLFGLLIFLKIYLSFNVFYIHILLKKRGLKV